MKKNKILLIIIFVVLAPLFLGTRSGSGCGSPDLSVPINPYHPGIQVREAQINSLN